jgi:hypothetical protein
VRFGARLVSGLAVDAVPAAGRSLIGVIVD